MPKQLQITIPEPCHENWAEMTPTQQGAYCKVCSKNVIDFTTKTENEIYDILTQSDGNTCGRFTSFQLQQPIRKTEVNNGWFNWRAIAASLAALVAFEETARASGKAEKVSVTVEALTAISNRGETGTGDEINGMVLDAENHEPIPDAYLIWQDDSSVVSTDLEGRFTLLDTGGHTSNLLTIKAFGFDWLTIDVNSLRNNQAVFLHRKQYADSIVTLTSGKVTVSVTDTSIIKGVKNVIAGKVIDADTKEPLYGATVYCKSDRTVYRITDESGEFKMPVDSSLYKNDTVVIQYLGFTNREIPVADFTKKYNGSALEIQMSQAVLGSFDVVVVSPVKMGKFKKAHMRRMERKNSKGH